MNRFIVFLMASLSLHGLVLIGSGLFVTQKAELKLQAGENSVEVELISAPLETPQEIERPPEQHPEIPTPAPEDIVIPEPKQPPHELAHLPKPKLLAVPPTVIHRGDRSSEITGQAATTLKSMNGESLAKPSYLRNPEPPYPEMLRSKRIEGRLSLWVRINTRGTVDEARIMQSSGYPEFDQSALKTVRDKYRFTPARMMGIPVVSEVEIPIVFQIK